jgi:adenosylcobinamide-phosphate synthase
MSDPVAPCVLAAYVLDLLLGDPRWLPHPVRLIGLAARALEAVLTRILGRTRFAGLLFTVLIVGCAAWGTWALIRSAAGAQPWLGFAVTTYLLFTSFAARDLDAHATRIAKALEGGDLPAAREKLSLIVGRDTAALDESEVVRGAVESVAESTLDGVIAPLFFAAIGGAPAAIAFKAASTLDSMVGHKTERYLLFGWASARLDDVLNWVPARLAKLIYPVASWVTGLRPGTTWRIAGRDGRNSPSPNAGISEAALAGALGVRLGGTNTYDGVAEVRPPVGDPLRALETADIRRSVLWMYASSILALALFAGARLAAFRLIALHPLP